MFSLDSVHVFLEVRPLEDFFPKYLYDYSFLISILFKAQIKYRHLFHHSYRYDHARNNERVWG